MAFLTRAAVARTVAIVAFGLLMRAPARGHQPDDGEDAIKAAFLYNFTKFVDWPAGAFDTASGAFRVCVLADDAFVRQLDATLRGETVRGRPIELASADAVGTGRRCHLVFFAGSRTEPSSRLLPSLRRTAVLTVGESPRFLEQGGAIAFIRENNRVRFDVNMLAIEEAGLSVSSKLLRVARHVARGHTR